MALAQNIQPIQVPRSPQQRFWTIALVVAFHLGVIAAFVVALNPKLAGIEKTEPIKVAIDKTKQEPPTAPMPAKPTLQNPTIVNIPRPDIPLSDGQDSRTISGTQTFTGPTTSTETFVAATGITSTHTTPDYPLMAVRLNETGNVHLKLWIDEAGTVVSATVERSSGYDDLDDAAVAWVKQHWRYTPATRDGKATIATTDAIVTFRLAGRS